MDPGMANPTHSMSSEQRQRVADAEQQARWDDQYVLHCADTLLCCLASNLNGLSLPHSLYTFTLLHHQPYQHQHTAQSLQPPTVFPLLHQPLLRLLSRLVLHTSHACRGIVSRADLYEEEEWSMHDYGLSIEQEGGGEALLREATSVEQSIEGAIRADKRARQQQPARREKNSGDDRTPAGLYLEAALDRVRLCHALLLLFSHLNKPAAPLHTAHKLLTRAASHLHSVMHNTVLAPPNVTMHVQALDTFRASADCPFDPSIAASLILHAPPRLHPLLSLPAALTLLHQLLTHTSLLLASSSLTSLPSLLNFVAYFASQRPNIVLRSVLLLSLLDETDVNRSDRSLFALLSDALHNLSPSAALFAHPTVRWAVFGPLPADVPAELRTLPPPDLTTSWMSHMSTLVQQHFRLLLMDPTRQRRKVGSALQLALHLQPAAVSVDQWLTLACRRLHVEQAESTWYMADHIPAQQRRQLEEADRRLLFGSSYYSLVLDAACSLILHQLVSLFSQQLAVDEELSVLYFSIQHYAHCKVNNARSAWRDDKLTAIILEQQRTSDAAAVAATAKKKRGKQQQQQHAYKSLSVTPPANADTLLSECVALLSAAMQSLIHGMARLKLPSGSPAVSVPLLPSDQLPAYFSNRFPWQPDHLLPTVSSALYEQQMNDDFAPSLDAEHILAVSGRLFNRAKEQLATLQHMWKQHPPLPASTTDALIGQGLAYDAQPASSAASTSSMSGSESISSSAAAVLLPSARVVAISDLSARSVLPFDGAFLHSLTRLAVNNAVTAATVAKKVTTAHAAPSEQSKVTAEVRASGADCYCPPLRARFSFAANWLFPAVSVEPARGRAASTSVQ